MTVTIARRQAKRLRALAEHFEMNPQLVGVDAHFVSRDDFLTISWCRSDPEWHAAALWRWAVSIGASTAVVSTWALSSGGRPRVHVHGRSAAGRSMWVATVIDGFTAALNSDQAALLAHFGTCAVPLSTLVDFAERAGEQR